MNATADPTRRALGLEYLSIGWASIEAAVALITGIAAGSVALVAFGADSAVELASAVVVTARLGALINRRPTSAAREHRDHRILAVLFFALAAYVSASAAVALAQSHQPTRTIAGLVICIASAVAMPALAWAKRVTSTKVAHSSPSVARLLAADATESALCGWLGLSTLIGVVAGAWIGWWWADPAAGLVVVFVAIREGAEEWRCEDPVVR